MDQTAPVKGHPKGLYVLFATEMWERFNYYGMRAVLILFMTKALLFDDLYASNLYGSYTGLVFFTPLLGGYIADRYWGNNRSIVLGGIIMALGELLLFFCASTYDSLPSASTFLFFAGLSLMIAGNGCFKPNISSMVGQLYPANDRRIDAGYTVFYMGINIGAVLGPLICGWTGDTGNPSDFKWAFLAAAIAMSLSVVVQLLFQKKHIHTTDGRPLGQPPANAPAAWKNPAVSVLVLIVFAALALAVLYIDANYFSFLSYLLVAAVPVIAVVIFTDKSLTRVEKSRMSVIFIMVFFVIFFWAAYEQTGASLTLFADRQTDRDLGFFVVPASFFQIVNPLIIIVFAPLFAWMWLKMGSKQPSAPVKMSIGLLVLGIGYWWIAWGVKGISPDTRVSMIWLIGMYAFHTWGEIALYPTGLALANKLAPLKYASLLMAVWFLSNAAGSKLAGVLSGLYPDGRTTYFLGYEMNTMYDFFMLFVVMSGVAAVLLFLISRTLQRMMHLPEKNNP